MTVSFFFRSILMFKVLTDLLIDIRDVRIVFFFASLILFSSLIFVTAAQTVTTGGSSHR